MRRGALTGLRHEVAGPHRAEVCALAVETFGKYADPKAAEIVVARGGNQPCSSEWDEFLTKVEEHEKKGLGASPRWLSQVFGVHRRLGATPEQEACVTAFAVRTVEDRANDPATRIWALGYAAQASPDWRTLLERMAKDPDPHVRVRADELWSQRTGEPRRYAGNDVPLPPLMPTTTGTAPTPPQPPRIVRDDAYRRWGADAFVEDEIGSAPRAQKPAFPAWLVLANVVIVFAAVAGPLVLLRRLRRSAFAPVPPMPSVPASGPPPVARPSDAPVTRASSPSGVRLTCAAHGIAAGPDGRCVLCRRSTEPAASRAQPAVHWKRVGLGVSVGVGLIAVYALLRLGNPVVYGMWVRHQQGPPAYPGERRIVPVRSPQPVSAGGFQYVGDEWRAPARNVRSTFMTGDAPTLSSPAFTLEARLALTTRAMARTSLRRSNSRIYPSTQRVWRSCSRSLPCPGGSATTRHTGRSTIFRRTSPVFRGA